MNRSSYCCAAANLLAFTKHVEERELNIANRAANVHIFTIACVGYAVLIIQLLARFRVTRQVRVIELRIPDAFNGFLGLGASNA